MELIGKISHKIKIISLDPEIKMDETFRKGVVDAAFRNGNGYFILLQLKFITIHIKLTWWRYKL